MITISLCMIVKNESKVLRRCLDSLKGLCDEIVIVDTGSTDDTKAIALEYTDKVYDLEWRNDFSYARNFAFSKCSMDYIYSVDADEVLDETNRQRFLLIKENLLTEIEIVQMWYVNTDEYATTENFAKELRPKLFKRLRTFTWIDPVHESVNLNPVVFDSDIEILHRPLSNHAGRDFNVFIKAIERGEYLSNKLVKMYARELMKAGSKDDFVNAKEFFVETTFDETRDDEIRTYCYCVLSKAYRLLNDSDEFFKWSLKNICTKPCAEICNEIGHYYYSKGDYDEAIIWYINASSETEAVLDIDASCRIPFTGLADCYEKLADANAGMKEAYLAESIKYKDMAKEKL